MRINFTARHFKASDRLKEYAEKKVQRLKKYYDGIIDCEIILDYEKLNQIAEIAIKVYSQRLVAIEKSEDIYKSIDLAVDKLERQVKKFKEKLREHSNEKAATIAIPDETENEEI
jgi:putative sigma-54 modulation protein